MVSQIPVGFRPNGSYHRVSLVSADETGRRMSPDDPIATSDASTENGPTPDRTPHPTADAAVPDVTEKDPLTTRPAPDPNAGPAATIGLTDPGTSNHLAIRN